MDDRGRLLARLLMEAVGKILEGRVTSLRPLHIAIEVEPQVALAARPLLRGFTARRTSEEEENVKITPIDKDRVLLELYY